MKPSPPTSPRKTGRPRSFDRDAVLQQAMLMFWQYGYETTSIADLTQAMGVSAPSLYATFGDKKQLFLQAMRLYAGDAEETARVIHGAATAYDAARHLLTAAATTYTGESTPKGCLLASAAATGSSASADVRHAVAEIRRDVQGHLRKRIERDIESGVLPTGTNAAGLSGLIMAVTQGMSVLARDGATRGELQATIEAALRAWPAMLLSRA